MNKKIILISAALTSFMTAFMGSAVNIALPIMGKEFHISAVLLSWTATAYLLASAALLIPAGKLSDIYGRSKLFKIGLIVFTLGTALCSFSTSGVFLIFSRVIQGIGSSMIFSTSTALVVSAFPPNERGKVLGITISAVYIGLSSSPFLSGLITDYLGWRYIFFITMIFGITLSTLIIIYIKEEWKEAAGETFDTAGSLILSAILISLMIGFSFLPGFNGIILITLSIILSIIFYRIEKKKTHPIFNFNIFRANKTFTFSNIAALINYSATFAVGFLMSFYLQIVKGFPPRTAGTILITQPVLMALFSPLSGRLSDKIEPQVVASIGMGIITIGLLLFAFLSEGFNLILIIINLALLGFGFALFSSPNSNAIMGSVEKRFYGVASSILASMRMIGQMLSMGLVIILFSILIGNEAISPANKDKFMISAKAAFILFSIMCFLGIFASISRGKIHDRKEI